ncbi:hypothetical protein [Flavobacterium sp. 7A]|uniref:hypothetical protein n=1 Tax=Flavobacterium sp. 7A TaxID=2940571 RepID=UPI002225B967|nr:hypothetical protein [Flavobacterium sp. 7A]
MSKSHILLLHYILNSVTSLKINIGNLYNLCSLSIDTAPFRIELIQELGIASFSKHVIISM